jgi:hypothetical protein
MIVKASKTSSYGIRVGASNTAIHFNKDWQTVELEIDGEFHTFPLSKTFWTTCPELRGRALNDWFPRHGLAPWPRGKTPQLILTPLGPSRFRLSIPHD